jgi:hypothetical protein
VRGPAVGAEASPQLLFRGRGWSRLPETDGSATFTSFDGRTERAAFDVDSDPLYDRGVGQVARTLGERFRGLPTPGELEDVMRIIGRAHQAHREGAT